jgi:hypothetical protein
LTFPVKDGDLRTAILHCPLTISNRAIPAADRRLDGPPGSPAVNHSSTVQQYGPGMDETQNLAVRALRELLDNPDRNDWDELLAANRELIKAIAKNKPMTRKDRTRVAKYLREAGWQERAIGAATVQVGTTGYADLRETG